MHGKALIVGPAEDGTQRLLYDAVLRCAARSITLMFTQAFPTLTTPDLPRALAFYRDLLGGEVTYQFPPDGMPAYVSVRIGDSELGLGQQEEPGELVNNRITIWVYADDCDVAVATLRNAGVPVVREPADRPWGKRVAMVEDPDGNPVLVAGKREPAAAAHHRLTGWGTSPRVTGMHGLDCGSTPPGPEARLRQVCAAAGLDLASSPRRVESGSNDAWLVDDRRLGAVVLRVAWRGDLTRLAREAAVLRQAPAGVHGPRVIRDGRTSVNGFPVSYALTRRIAGQPLVQRWPRLTAAERRSAVAQLAQALRELHQWTPPPPLAELVCTRPPSYLDTVDWVVGTDLHTLPPSRALALARHPLSLPHVDRDLIAAAIDAIHELSDLDVAVDDPARHGLIHADLHLHNLWWSESGALTLLDFEWVRFGPPDLELQPLCDLADEDVRSGRDQYPTVLRLLASDYPELFQAPDLPARLRLYSLAYVLRQVIITVPDQATDYVHRLQRLVSGQWPASGAAPGLG
jgi:uncharacterized glyoxalase superfamily protein PhnB/aminoglycoside phosphotransferase (APT) family kinase protein